MIFDMIDSNTWRNGAEKIYYICSYVSSHREKGVVINHGQTTKLEEEE
jgi:hypothetical protein